MTPLRQSTWPWWRCAITGLSALGVSLSAYLSWHYLVGGTMIGCTIGNACDEVLSSRWNAIGGVVPVSGLAMGAYLAMLVASLAIGPGTEASVRQLAWRALQVLAGAAAGSAGWFIFVQKWEIRAFCPYCMATHVTSLVLAAVVLGWAPRAVAARFSIMATPALGLMLAGLLAASQVVFAPPSVSRAGATVATRMPPLDPHAVPLIGSPDAPSVVMLLFDYECPHCQHLHAMLDDVVRLSGGKVAFILCPAPLNPECNPYIPLATERFEDSCQLTKIALSVWVANHAAYGDFDHWMFSGDAGQPWQARSPEDAEAKAVALVGRAKFDAAKADPWIEHYLQTSVKIFGSTGADAVPKLVFGPRWVTPEPTDAEDLAMILRRSLAVPMSLNLNLPVLK